MSDTEPTPFTISVDDNAIKDLQYRLTQTRWPDQIPETKWEYGANLEWLRETALYWASDYNWRTAETELNDMDHVVTTINGQRIHAIHQKSPHPRALPLMLIHGWPGSVVEFLDIIGPLTNPTKYGGDEIDAFHVIAPSLPGYGWSGPTKDRGWDIHRTAHTFCELLLRLGYRRYGLQGGDWGSFISRLIAGHNQENVVGCHVNMIIARPPGEKGDFENITPLEQQLMDRFSWYGTEDNGYFRIQETRPQTLGTALNDSPAGLLSWMGEKFRGWTDCGGDPFSAISRDRILTNASVYWFTGTINSSMRMYFETMKAQTLEGETGKVPLGVSIFPYEIMGARRRWVEAAHNLTFWNEHEKGGHFAALEQPDRLVHDIREFFQPLR